jgi:hypothetical protein
MQPSEKAERAPRTRHAKSNGAPIHGSRKGSGAKSSIQEIVKMGRGFSSRVQRDMDTHPEALLLAVGGASFVAGAVLGSRLGRILLSAAIPLGLQHLVESEVGPRLRSYVKELLQDPTDDAT